MVWRGSSVPKQQKEGRDEDRPSEGLCPPRVKRATGVVRVEGIQNPLRLGDRRYPTATPETNHPRPAPPVAEGPSYALNYIAHTQDAQSYVLRYTR